jgi:hypothetical protein
MELIFIGELIVFGATEIFVELVAQRCITGIKVHLHAKPLEHVLE